MITFHKQNVHIAGILLRDLFNSLRKQIPTEGDVVFVEQKAKELYHHLTLFFPKNLFKPCTHRNLLGSMSHTMLMTSAGFLDLCIVAPVQHRRMWERFSRGAALLSTQEGERHHGPIRKDIFDGNFISAGPNNMYDQAIHAEYVRKHVLPIHALAQLQQVNSYKHERKESHDEREEGSMQCEGCGVSLPLVPHREMEAEAEIAADSQAFVESSYEGSIERAFYNVDDSEQQQFYEECMQEIDSYLAYLQEQQPAALQGEEQVDFNVPSEETLVLCKACGYSQEIVDLLRGGDFKGLLDYVKVSIKPWSRASHTPGVNSLLQMLNEEARVLAEAREEQRVRKLEEDAAAKRQAKGKRIAQSQPKAPAGKRKAAKRQ